MLDSNPNDDDKLIEAWEMFALWHNEVFPDSDDNGQGFQYNRGLNALVRYLKNTTKQPNGLIANESTNRLKMVFHSGRLHLKNSTPEEEGKVEIFVNSMSGYVAKMFINEYEE